MAGWLVILADPEDDVAEFRSWNNCLAFAVCILWFLETVGDAAGGGLTSAVYRFAVRFS